jgi:chitin disaccharide deacetylase
MVRSKDYVKYLIVNADDFGASRGINRAILDLHDRGVVTSTSLMITMPAAADAAALAKKAPDLGVGLHVTLTDEECRALVDFDDASVCSREIEAQIEKFFSALGRLPTHLDSHQNVHRDQRLGGIFQAFARRYSLPMREHSPVRYFSNFYGQWDGEPHPEHIAIESLLQMLAQELREGITELSCHPGYVGPDFSSPYEAEREIEVRTLSDPRFIEFLCDRNVRLINFGDATTAWSRAYA